MDLHDSSIDELALDHANAQPTFREQRNRSKPVLRESSTNQIISPKPYSKTATLTPIKNGPSTDAANTGELVLHTPTSHGSARGQGTQSPWRIRVTVEADENGKGPGRVGRGDMSGRGTKVPLKNAEESSKPMRRRTRNSTLEDAKSMEADVMMSRKRGRAAATPARKTRQRQSEQTQQVPDGDEAKEEPPKKKRGRPRKSDVAQGSARQTPKPSPGKAEARHDQERGNVREATDIITSLHNEVAVPAADAPTDGRKTAARKTMDFSKLTPAQRERQNPKDLAESTTGSQPDKYWKSVAGRKATPRKPPEGIETGNENNGDDAERLQLSQERYTSTQNRKDTASDQTEDYESSDGNIGGDPADDYELSEETSALNRSAVESEGFSMVSIESLRSQKEQAERVAQLEKASRTADQGNSQKKSATQSNLEMTFGSQRGQNEESEEAQMGLKEAETTVASKHQLVDGSKTNKAKEPNIEYPPLQTSQQLPNSNDAQQPIIKYPALPNAQPVSKVHAPDRATPANQLIEPRRAKSDMFGAFGDSTRRKLRESYIMGQRIAQEESGADKASVHPQPRIPSTRIFSANEPKKDLSDARVQDGRLPTPADSSDSGQDPALGGITVESQSNRVHHNGDEMSWRPTDPPREGHVQSLRRYDEMSWQPTILMDAAQNHTEDDVDVIEGKKGLHEGQQTQMSIAGASDVWREEADRSPEDSMEEARNRRPPSGLAVQSSDPQLVKPCPPNQSVESHAAHERRKIIPFNNAAPSPVPSLSDLVPGTFRPPRAKLPKSWRRESGDSTFLYSDEADSAMGSPWPSTRLMAERAKQKKKQERQNERSETFSKNFGSPALDFEKMSVPSVFRRWGASVNSEIGADAQHCEDGESFGMKDTANGSNHQTQDLTPRETPEPPRSPRKSILASPTHHPSSPAKEVHFPRDEDMTSVFGDADGVQRSDMDFYSQSNSDQDYSERSQPDITGEPNGHEDSAVEDNSMAEEDVDQESVALGRSQLDGTDDTASMSESSSLSELESSDMSQLQNELRTRSSVSSDSDDDDDEEEPTTNMDTSDARQLQQELHATASSKSSDKPDSVPQHGPAKRKASHINDDEYSSAQLNPSKKRSRRLFDEAHLGTEAFPTRLSHPQRQSQRKPQRKPPPPPQSSTFDASEGGFLSRLASVFLPHSWTHPTTLTSKRNSPTALPAWTPNHFEHLNHIRLHAKRLHSSCIPPASNNPSLSNTNFYPESYDNIPLLLPQRTLKYTTPPPRGNNSNITSLPPAFFASPLPPHLAAFIGQKVSTTPHCNRAAHRGDSHAASSSSSVPTSYSPVLGAGGVPGDCPPDCPGIPESLRGKTLEHTWSERDVRVALAFAADVKDSGVVVVDVGDGSGGFTEVGRRTGEGGSGVDEGGQSGGSDGGEEDDGLERVKEEAWWEVQGGVEAVLGWVGAWEIYDGVGLV